jgi:hypothetical protein
VSALIPWELGENNSSGWMPDTGQSRLAAHGNERSVGRGDRGVDPRLALCALDLPVRRGEAISERATGDPLPGTSGVVFVSLSETLPGRLSRPRHPQIGDRLGRRFAE